MRMEANKVQDTSLSVVPKVSVTFPEPVSYSVTLWGENDQAVNRIYSKFISESKIVLIIQLRNMHCTHTHTGKCWWQGDVERDFKYLLINDLITTVRTKRPQITGHRNASTIQGH